jgi:hypothetical protein
MSDIMFWFLLNTCYRTDLTQMFEDRPKRCPSNEALYRLFAILANHPLNVGELSTSPSSLIRATLY